MLTDKLNEYSIYKNLILNGKTGKRNVLVERKDGSHAVLHHYVKKYLLEVNLPDIERITVFFDGKEYEFVACQ